MPFRMTSTVFILLLLSFVESTTSLKTGQKKKVVVEDGTKYLLPASEAKRFTVERCKCDTYDEEGNYCDCRIDEEDGDNYSDDDCFPAESKLLLENGKTVKMEELAVGDKVQTVSADGRLSNSDVKTFLKKQGNVVGLYKLITTSRNETIRLSGNHLIYGRRSYLQKFMPLYAEEILVGDEVLVPENGEMTPVNVINTFNSVRKGAYTPITKEGNIVVDGVLASCYASFPHDLGQIVMMPMRWFPRAIEWVFGEDNGKLGYATVLHDLAKWTYKL